MEISVDGGGLCSQKKFGNYIFSLNLIQALANFDKKNLYTIYSFCQKPKELKLGKNFTYKLLLPKKFWMSARVSLEEKLHRQDIFLALNQAIPLYTRAKIIGFSHGLSYRFFPNLYKNDYQRLNRQFDELAKRSSHIIVSSQKVKDEIGLKKVEVIPYGVPFDMINDSGQARMTRQKYFLYVGMEHPIKNIEFLKRVVKKFPGYKLYLVHDRKRDKLMKLYSNATAYLTASLYESFNLPVLEALSLGCPVVGLESAIIPELKEFVEVAHDKEEFIDKLKKIIQGNYKRVPINEIQKKFSWQIYVKKLIKLY